MRFIKRENAVSGTKLAKPVVRKTGEVLLTKNAVLSEGMINLLGKYEIDYLYIDDELTSNINIEEVIPLELKIATTSAMKNVNIEKTVDSAKKMAEQILSASNLSVDIYNNSDSDIFIHSMSVMELSLAIGKAIGYSSDRLGDLAVAALLHDVGKLCVDKEVTKKNELSKLFENSFLNLSLNDYNDRMHSTYSYNIIANNTFVTSVVKQSVLMHHENYDGTGVLKVPQEKVHEFAKILRVADTFINIVSKENNEYNIKTTSEALEFMAYNKGSLFDPLVVDAFLTKVPIYPVGMSILLSDYTKAIIAKNNKQFPARPLIITEDSRIVDLAERDYLTLNIMGIDPEPGLGLKLKNDNLETLKNR